MIPASDGSAYISTGITVSYREIAGRKDGKHCPGWGASLDFQDAGLAGDDDADTGAVSTEGTLYTRYAVVDGDTRTGLSAAVDALIADAARLGIEFRNAGGPTPYLYYKGDGEWEDYPPPEGWREILAAEAERIGWTSPYRIASTT
jgi:hypothetical protein